MQRGEVKSLRLGLPYRGKEAGAGHVEDEIQIRSSWSIPFMNETTLRVM
jgi:hypothetical protein